MPFNSALIHTACLSFPDDEIVFFAEKFHLEYVKQKLVQFPEYYRIEFRAIKIPKRESSGWQRLPAEYFLCNLILSKAPRLDTRAIIFCSVTNMSLLSLKLLMQIKHFNLPSVAVVHGYLSSITPGREPRRPWNWIITLQHVLALPHPRNLRLIALGDSILANVRKILPRLESQWESLDHVYLWPQSDIEKPNRVIENHRPVRFGYVGVSGKGFETFFQLAQEIEPQSDIAQFTMVGFFKGPVHKKPVSRFLPQIPTQPLSPAEYQAGMTELTYIVWTAKPSQYRLTASGTFLDAIAFLKPGIYLRNEYIEYYFDHMGDIGYLCDSFEEMLTIIREIIVDFPLERYLAQVSNIQKGRYIFEPKTLAPRLRDILENYSLKEAQDDGVSC